MIGVSLVKQMTQPSVPGTRLEGLIKDCVLDQLADGGGKIFYSWRESDQKWSKDLTGRKSRQLSKSQNKGRLSPESRQGKRPELSPGHNIWVFLYLLYQRESPLHCRHWVICGTRFLSLPTKALKMEGEELLLHQPTLTLMVMHTHGRGCSNTLTHACRDIAVPWPVTYCQCSLLSSVCHSPRANLHWIKGAYSQKHPITHGLSTSIIKESYQAKWAGKIICENLW